MTTKIHTSPIRQDLFDAIKFDNGANPKKDSPTGKQLGPHFVFAWIFHEAWTKITQGLATANKYQFHTTRALFNDDATWLGYEVSIRIAFGRCLVYFVTNKMLPLTCVNPHQDKKFYVIVEPK